MMPNISKSVIWGPLWSFAALCWPMWSYVVQYDPIKPCMWSYVAFVVHCGPSWSYEILSDSAWTNCSKKSYMVQCGPIRPFVVMCGQCDILWCTVVQCGAMVYNMGHCEKKQCGAKLVKVILWYTVVQCGAMGCIWVIVEKCGPMWSKVVKVNKCGPVRSNFFHCGIKRCPMWSNVIQQGPI